MSPAELHAQLMLAALRSAPKPSSPAEVEKHAIWLLAAFHADQAHSFYDRSDMIELFMNGTPPIIDSMAECFALCDDDEDADSSNEFLDFLHPYLNP